jgi:hypothetical protein
MKQLIDLLRQIGDSARDPDTARTARIAAESLFRGVVAASSPAAEDLNRPTSEGPEPT